MLTVSAQEGSFLKAYGTYEYFERGPPSIVYSIMTCFSSREMRSSPMTSSSLRSFSYTAILPFADHLDFRAILPHLDDLDVQLAPVPGSNILNDKSRIGRAQMEDCWQELRAAYRLRKSTCTFLTLLGTCTDASEIEVTRSFHTFAISADGTPKLKKFICRDYQILALEEDLDDEFTPLCLPCWCEDPRGVFSRLAAVPPTYDQY